MAVEFKNESFQRKLISFLSLKGLTVQGICGAMGNMWSESRLNPRNAENSYMTKFGITDEEYIEAVDNGTWKRPDTAKPFTNDSIGFGLCQWTSSGRKLGLYLMAAQMGKSVADEDVQLEWFYEELSKNYKGTLSVLKDSNKTLSDCARYFMLHFEKPKNQSEANQLKRVKNAEDIWEHYFNMKTYTIRTEKPSKNDKYIAYYNTVGNGGLSQCIKGNEPDAEANVLRNCVGYANGRFNEIISELTGVNGMRYQLTTDAERFIEQAKAKGLAISQYPANASIMVWQKGNINHSDGSGHVEIVEKVLDYNKVYTSRSGWTSPVFANTTRANSNGNWGKLSPYKFRGFIVNPYVDNNPYPIPSSTLKKGMKTEEVKWLQWQMCKKGYVLDIDGSFGGNTDKMVRKYQADHNLTVDGKVGGATRRSLLEWV